MSCRAASTSPDQDQEQDARSVFEEDSLNRAPLVISTLFA